MNVAVAGEKFDPSKRYASSLMIIFIVFTYFTGIPILILFGALSFIFLNLVEKYLITQEYS